MGANILPKKNELGFYEIRMESIGGLGANLAGKMLAEAGIIGQGLNGAVFASYGSEKKGTPVKSNLRFAEANVPIRVISPVEEPHLLVIFHENLIEALSVTAGVKSDATIVVNTSKSPKEIRNMLKLQGGKVCCVDAIKISIEEKVKLNTTMMGAVAKASGFLDINFLKETIKKTFEKRYANLIEPNIRAFDRGASEMTEENFSDDGKYPYIPFKVNEPALGWKNQPLGGTIVDFGNSVKKDLSASRVGYIPVFNKEKCTSCAFCDLTCPDMCMVWKEEEVKGKMQVTMQGIDYQYCKGCLRCVASCTFGAMTSELEANYDVSSMRKQKYEMIA